MLRWGFGLNGGLSGEDVAREVERSAVHGANGDLGVNEVQGGGSGSWSRTGSGAIGANEVQGGGRVQDEGPIYDTPSKYSAGLGITISGDKLAQMNGRRISRVSKDARDAGLAPSESQTTVSQEAQQQEEERRVPSQVKTFDLSKIGGSDYYSSEAELPFVEDSIPANITLPGTGGGTANGGWTGSNALTTGMPISSYSSEVVNDVGMEQARESDKFDNKAYANKGELKDLKAEASKAASDAIKSGRYGYDIPDLSGALVDESGDVKDPWDKKSEIPYTDLPSSNVLSDQAIKQTKKKYKVSLSHDDVGGRVWEKMMPDGRLRFNEVGIGMSDLEALVEQDPTHIDELLSDIFPDGAHNHSVMQIAFSINYAARRRNGNEVRVGVSKPPDVRISDAQSMVLRIVTDKPRGIFIHPLMAPLFNADFDGDDGNVSIDKEMAKMLRDTIDLLIDPDGTTHIDEKWFSTVKIVDNVVDGMDRRDFVKEIMFGDLLFFNNVEVSDDIVDAVLELGDNDDPDKKNACLVRLIREIRKFAGDDNNLLGDILMATYNTFQQLSRRIAADTVGTYVDELVAPRTNDDRIILKFVDDFVKGRIPNNWYDFKAAFNSFIGDIRSGNSDFRISASVGKRFKLNNDLLIGDEYIIKFNDQAELDTFLEATMEYASAARQTHEEKQRGRSYSHTRQLRERVIEKVGYPDSMTKDANGNDVKRYGNVVEWLNQFIRVYRVEAALENEANLIVKSNLQISQSSNRNVVAAINPSGSKNRVTYGNVVDAIVEVYSDTMIDRIFTNILWKEHQVLTDQQIKLGYEEREIWRPGGKGNFATKEKYRSYTVRRFSKDNHLIYNRRQQDNFNNCIIPVYDPSIGKWIVEDYGKVKVKDENGNQKEVYKIYEKQLDRVSDNMVEMMLLRAIADQKTSSESAYASRVYGYVDNKVKKVRPTFRHDKKHYNAQQRKNEETDKYYDQSGQHKTLMKMRFDLLKQMRDAKRRNSHGEFRDILRTLCASGPEMFSFFGMDSENGWNDSEFSKAMLNAKNLDQLGGVNMTMHYAMRTNEIFASLKALKEYASAPGMAELEAETMNNIAFMEQELASASQTWQAIVLEMHTGEGWAALQDLAKDMKANPDKYEGTRTYLEAAWYWDNPLHKDVDSMMRDAGLGFVEKRDILCDLVRMQTEDSTFVSYEVCLQLEVGASGEWSLGYDGQQQLFETYNNFERKFNQYSDISHENMKKNIEEAYDKFGDSKGALVGAIHNLATHLGLMYRIGFDTMADAVCSTMDRLYEQSEKSSTHPWANAVYQLLSHQHTGGYFNELYRTDDLIVGLQNISQITARDLIMILDDPKFTVSGYNDIGEIVQINRDSLLGFKDGETYDVERELWKFLRDNPRIAGCIRMQAGAVSAGSEGKGYTVAACDTTETIERSYGMNGETFLNPMDDMAYLMFDHPGFHAIASLCTPAFGSKASHRSPKIEATERYMCYLLYMHATKDKRKAAKNADEILKSLGITRGVLRENLMNDFDRMVAETEGIEEREEAVREREGVVSGLTSGNKILMYGMYDNCRAFITDYLTEIANSPTIDLKAGMKGVERPVDLRVDMANVHAFYDVIQELSGAKTEVSTGIEGSETFQFGQWSSLIAAKDRYADLKAIRDELEDDPELCQTFDGAMTNGGAIRVVNGRIDNYDELEEAVGVEDLVVLCPDTYEVRDRMIDSQGRYMSSQKAYMMSKRSDGTEGHNLQVMKTGIDGLDSITKVKSKYFRDEKGNIVDYDKRVTMIREAAKKGETEDEQMFLAKLCLSRELLRSNEALKYDCFTLSNYMCIADLMLIRGDDGEIYLRSLEQLYTALKHRIGVYGNDMSNEQRKRLAMIIVEGKSEYGCIGRARSSSSGEYDQTPLSALDSLRPSRVSPATRGIYSYLSDRATNRKMIDEITHADLENPLPERDYAWSDLRRERIESEIRQNHEWVNKTLKNAFILRQYHIVGCVDGSKWDEFHEVGMSSLFIIGKDIGRVTGTRGLYDLMHNCWKHGETIMVPAELVEGGYVHQLFAKEAMPCVTSIDGEPTWYMINTFHMRLNGAEAKPYRATYAQAQYPDDKDWFAAEDTFGEFDYGDSGGLVTQSGHDKVKLSQQPRTIQLSANELFAQQFQTLGDNGAIDISFVDQRTLDGVLNHSIDLEIDIGVVKGAQGYDRRVRDIEAAIERYKQKQDSGDGMILDQECKAGDIVGWAMAKVRETDGTLRYVLAPIIPFELHGAVRGMEKFKCTDVVFKDGDHNKIAITVQNTSELDGYAKMHLPSSGADKVMIDLSIPVDLEDQPRTLMNGMLIDSYVDARTTMNRRIGTLSRLRTMETLIRVARMNGYNFANAAGAFPEADPNAPEGSREWNAAAMKETLRNYPPPSSDNWRQVINTIRFHADPLIDAFVRYNCRKCLDDGGNPSHFLASEFIDPTVDPNNPINSKFKWEYLASFENSLTYEDAFLKFFSLMNPNGDFKGRFCPSGIDDNSSDCLFRLKQDQNGNLADGYDLGVLQMQVPHKFVDFDRRSKWVYVWECVFSGTAFFGEDFSAGSRPNIEGSSRMSDTMNMIGSLDFDLTEADNRMRYGWSTADMSHLPMTGSAVTM